MERGSLLGLSLQVYEPCSHHAHPSADGSPFTHQFFFKLRQQHTHTIQQFESARQGAGAWRIPTNTTVCNVKIWFISDSGASPWSVVI